MTIYMRLLAFALCMALPGHSYANKTFALVIGVNDYQFVTKLDGARNDALDIAAALDRSGAARIITLLDQDVSKLSVTLAWKTLMADAKKGDVIFVSYAGHGAQVPERIAGEEKDRMDEFWVLPGFDPSNIQATWRETVFDNELSDWFAEADRRGVRIVFISDSCQAGGMNRNVKGKLRFVQFGKDRLLGELLQMILREDKQAAVPETTLPANVTLLAATSEELPVPEVVIDGQPRGALSWSVARAIDGLADRDGNGLLSRFELEDYVLSTVRMRSESLQTPVFTPVAARDGKETVFTVQQKVLANTAVRPLQKTGKHIAMAHELGFQPVLSVAVKGIDMKIEDTVEGAHPYEWDAVTGVFKSPNGDIAAEKVSAFTVNDIVGKYILLDFLKAIATQNPGSMKISPERQVYLNKDRLRFEANPGVYRNMLVFNLANTGEIQFLDMVINGEPQMKTPLKEMQVVEPFGSDHLVSIASNDSLESIGRMLERGITPKELLSVLSQRIDGTDSSIAILPLYTRLQ